MKKSLYLVVALVLVVALFLAGGYALADPLGQPLSMGGATAFTYQGSLQRNGFPVNGNADLRFTLWNDAEKGTQVGTMVDLQSVAVTDGLFTVLLDFGAGAFIGQPRFLEISVRHPAGSGSYTFLTPRQAVTSAPYTLNANLLGGYSPGNAAGQIPLNNGTLNSTLNADLLDGQPGSYYLNANNIVGMIPDARFRAFQNLAFWGHLSNNSGESILTRSQSDARYAAIAHNHDSDYWRLGGSSVASTGVLGTTTNQAFEIWVNANRALRLEPHTTPILIVGSSSNWVTTGALGSVISGGGNSVAPNRVTDSYGTVGGGSGNQAGDDAGTATDRSHATVGGGLNNTASGSYSTVAGGMNNQARGYRATIGGGFNNLTTNWYSTVSGGESNSATNFHATVPGGLSNTASGFYSFAAGRRAQATHHGAFVWADSTDADFSSERIDQFRVRANGGARFDVNNSRWVNIYDNGARLINTSTGAYLTNGGAWTNSSDREAKENFAPVDGREILEILSGVSITTWNYKAEGPSVRHIGPMAQDFYTAFQVGDNDTNITTVDANGVALAAIQRLYQLVQEQGARIELLETEKAEMQERLTSIDARLAALEQGVGAFPRAAQPAGRPVNWFYLLVGGLAVAGLAVWRKE